MVVALEPVRFYGSSLPRPRFYKSKNEERVDPPVSVLDPFMAWAEKAHWSMGGVSFTRHRLQGRIEGSIEKLRAEREQETPEKGVMKACADAESPPMPPAPYVLKRKRRLVDEEEEEVESGLARKLEFEDVAVDVVKPKGENVKKSLKVDSGKRTPPRIRRNEDVAIDVVNQVKSESENVKKSLKVESGKRTSPRSRKNEGVAIDVVNQVKSKGENVKKSLKVESRKRTSPRLAKR